MKDKTRPPRDGLVRSVADVRAEAKGDGMTLTGHFAKFNEWTEINSAWEGNFMERVAPGAFAKTFRETTPKVLLNHGADPVLADKPLGRIRSLKEDAKGASYEVDLYDGIDPLVMSGLRDGAYGASFRFRTVKEELVEDPEPSESNPRGLPERTIQEAQVLEFGPVTFPAYEGATAGVRSLTDDYFTERFALDEPERLEALLASVQERQAAATEDEESEEEVRDEPVPGADESHSDESALSEGAEPTHSEPESRATTKTESADEFWSALDPNHKENW